MIFSIWRRSVSPGAQGLMTVRDLGKCHKPSNLSAGGILTLILLELIVMFRKHVSRVCAIFFFFYNNSRRSERKSLAFTRRKPGDVRARGQCRIVVSMRIGVDPNPVSVTLTMLRPPAPVQTTVVVLPLTSADPQVSHLLSLSPGRGHTRLRSTPSLSRQPPRSASVA